MRYTTVLFFLFFAFSFRSQTEVLDSLKNRLAFPVNNDTMRVFQYNEIAWNSIDFSIETSYNYCKKALNLAKKIDYLDGYIDAKNTLGIVYRITNKSQQAITTYEEVIRLRIKQGKEDRLTGAYSNLGSVYYEIGNTALALKMYKKAFDNSLLYQQVDNQLTLCSNLGIAYKSLGLYDQALSAFQKGLYLNRSIHDDFQEGQLYLNIATVYDQRKLFKEAIRYNKHALSIFRKQNNTRLIGTVLYNLSIETRNCKQFSETVKCLKEMELIAKQLDESDFYCLLNQTKANYYSEINQPKQALAAINIAITFSDSTNDLSNFTDIVLTKADVLRISGSYMEALNELKFGLELANRIADPLRLAKVNMTYYEVYKNLGQYDKALRFLEKANEIEQESTLKMVDNQIASLNAINELDRKEQDLAISNQRNQKITSENKRQTNLILGGGIIGVLVICLLALTVRSNQTRKKANQLLNQQNSQIQEQKQLVEEKQTEILDSIHYAKRIQTTLLAQESTIRSNLAESFIFFQPKDIVSGDFYWASESDNYFYLAVCDSTGHGVPGAFMSVLNISFLSEAINEKKIREPHEILNHVRKRLIEYISHDGAQDGMDGTLLCFDKTLKSWTYAAAYNAPILVFEGNLIACEADKMPIGKGEKIDSFRLFQLDAPANSMLYLITDGYADQFGGEKGKKFKIRQFNELLVEIEHQPVADQFEFVKSRFENWRGNLEQIDDVTVMGIRL